MIVQNLFSTPDTSKFAITWSATIYSGISYSRRADNSYIHRGRQEIANRMSSRPETLVTSSESIFPTSTYRSSLSNPKIKADMAGEGKQNPVLEQGNDGKLYLKL